MKKHYRHENDCANCGADLQGKFCHVCGQENLELKENFGHMMNHAISDYFHFDHQFFHTLKPLLFQPGKLTTEYMAGKRVQYLHPVKMYIFISLVYFVLLFQSGWNPVKISRSEKKTNKKELVAANKNFDSLINSPNTPAITKKVLIMAKQRTNESIKKADTTKDDDLGDLTGKKHKRTHLNFWGKDNIDRKDTTYEQYLSLQNKLADNKKDGFFKRYVRKREYELNSNNKSINEFMIEGVKHNTPKMMFLLLPLFALLLKITFWRNKKFYVEHLIYSFHFHCFLFLFLTVIMLTKMILPDSWSTVDDYINFFATLAIIFYIYKSLRAVYHRSRARTIFKMIGLSLSYTLVFGICMVLLVIVVALFN